MHAALDVVCWLCEGLPEDDSTECPEHPMPAPQEVRDAVINVLNATIIRDGEAAARLSEHRLLCGPCRKGHYCGRLMTLQSDIDAATRASTAGEGAHDPCIDDPCPSCQMQEDAYEASPEGEATAGEGAGV